MFGVPKYTINTRTQDDGKISLTRPQTAEHSSQKSSTQHCKQSLQAHEQHLREMLF
jgi:hypothetical protein